MTNHLHLSIIMKMRFFSLLSVGAVLALGASAAFGAEGWPTNYAKAKAQAKAENKLLLMDFTGSDWCPWCVKLNKEVFSQPQFKKYAADKLVLLDVDFPQTKPQPAALAQQNAKLQLQYKVEQFPTIIVLNAQGKKVGEVDYHGGGPRAFLAELDKLKK